MALLETVGYMSAVVMSGSFVRPFVRDEKQDIFSLAALLFLVCVNERDEETICGQCRQDASKLNLPPTIVERQR